MIKSLEWSLWIYDIAYYVLMYFCFRHAWKQGPQMVAVLMSAVLFGYIIEFGGVVTEPAAYQYNFFIIELPGPVPLGAVLGWGLIFYTSTTIAKRSNITWYIQPLFAGLIATITDFVIDPIVSFIGLWTWNTPSQFFDIPWINFVSWVGIVSCLSFFQQLGYRRIQPGSKGNAGNIMVAFIAMIPAYIAVIIWIYGYIWLVEQHWLSEVMMVGVIFGTIGLVVLNHVPKMKRNNEIEWEILAVPLFFFFWAIVMLYVSGLHNQFPELVIVFPAFIFLGLIVFSWPYLDTFLAQKKSM